MSEQEGYDGPARLVADGTEHPVTVHLRGMFQPIDGRFHWYGRVDHDEALDALGSGSRVLVETPLGSARGRLSDRDPWGRYRLAGTGRPPFPA